MTLADAGVNIGVSLSPLLPLRDVEGFGARLASLDAAEYVSQYFHPESSPFAAGTSAAVIRKAQEDGWGREEYRRARDSLSDSLGGRRPLLEGVCGFAPP
jgi:hypothetical protein